MVSRLDIASNTVPSSSVDPVVIMSIAAAAIENNKRNSAKVSVGSLGVKYFSFVFSIR